MNRTGWATLAVAAVMLFGCGKSEPESSGHSPDAGKPEHYRLTMPDTVAKGRYKRDHEAADPDGTLAEVMAGQVQDPTAAFGAYDPTVANKQNGLVLTVTGVYGTVLSPVTARDELVKVLDRRDEGPIVVAGPRMITPSGSKEPLQCRVAERKLSASDDTSMEASCTWADDSTVVKVAKAMGVVSPADVDLDAFASVVGAIRDEVRVAN
ncbi:hypothetical protein [Streptomyces olivochromogenes]|uniref:hypothetical protein n=1 Tax=Streptomyces olivochromogenes TaxID=1963 RepID=UPI001F18996E|nr:hypothetical protein [Streptomyces olivochromogenes]MCF3136671.1 hypothetical protein [Streptomyces olivochromogenes]